MRIYWQYLILKKQHVITLVVSAWNEWANSNAGACITTHSLNEWKKVQKHFHFFSKVSKIYFLDLCSFDLIVSKCLAHLILSGPYFKWMGLYLQCLILKRPRPLVPMTGMFSLEGPHLGTTFLDQAAPKKETEKVCIKINHITQSIRQHMNTRHCSHYYL